MKVGKQSSEQESRIDINDCVYFIGEQCSQVMNIFKISCGKLGGFLEIKS